MVLIEQQVKQLAALNEWFQTPLGLSVAYEFSKQLIPVHDYLKGDTLFQLGHFTHNLWLEELRFNKKWTSSPLYQNKNDVLICSLEQIPVQRNTMDCVIAPLVMEPYNHLNLIDELDRILKPMGYAVFLCLNPWSLWGGGVKCGLVNCYDNKPLKMISPLHLSRMLLHRGYRQCSLTNFYYVPPINNHVLIKKLSFFNEIGKMLWPFPSGFYCYIAQKYQAISPSPVMQGLVQSVPKEFVASLQPMN